MRALAGSPLAPTLTRGDSTSDLGAKLDGTPATVLSEFDECVAEEEMEEEEPTYDDEVAPTVYQDNDTIQILSEDEPECVMSPSCKKTQPPPEEATQQDKKDSTEYGGAGLGIPEPQQDSYYQNGGLSRQNWVWHLTG